MQQCIISRSPGASPKFFADAAEMLGWLCGHLHDVALISLDHDLPVRRADDGTLIDCGTGRDVVDYLITQEPACPVLVHTSNATAASGMLFALERAGWTAKQVYPHDDLCWVLEAWTSEVRAALEL